LEVSNSAFQGAKLVTASGVPGVITEADTFSTVQTSSGVYESTIAGGGTLIINGQPVNTLVKVVFHTTLDPNGQLRASVEHVDIKCL
jgi:hypothetical protein